jgi:hypothetical protein
MVKKGFMSLQLVNAETNLPFPEHRGPDGKDYVEVEPNAEYWIRIQSDEQNGKFICSFKVDGKDLGYHKTCHGCQHSDAGIWTLTGTQGSQQSLKVKPLHGVAGATFYIGKVKVNFYETGLKTARPKEPTNHVNKWKGKPSPGKGGEKAVASQVGTVVCKTSKSNSSFRYERGPLLQSITLQYCTAVGLIHVGVLPKPTSWEYHRMRYPANNNQHSSNGTHNIEPQLMKVQTRTPAGDLFQETTFELFDLTPLESDDDDDDDDDNADDDDAVNDDADDDDANDDADDDSDY